MKEIDAIRVWGVEGSASPSTRSFTAFTPPRTRVAFLYALRTADGRLLPRTNERKEVRYNGYPLSTGTRPVQQWPRSSR